MSDLSVLVTHLDDLGRARVLILGDLMLDRYLYGAVDRVSPEAPIPVIRVERQVEAPGGAGNVARNVAALGARATLIAVSGADDEGAKLAELLSGLARLDSRLLTAPDRRTTVKSRYVAAGQQLFRADHETTEPIDADTARRVIETLDDSLDQHDVVVLSDYAKGVLTDGVLSAVIERARQAAKPVIADPKSRDFGRYRGVSVLTPNRRELEAATGMPCGSSAEVTAAARQVMASCAVESVLVTLSDKGMVLVTADGETREVETAAREVFDVSGAGDTVVATLASALGADMSLPAAARLANVAAGLVVAKLGTAMADRGELANALYMGDMKGPGVKICTLEMARERVGQWRERGLKVGFTNGCFDLIHPGHVSLLNQAKAACDRLVVGLNGDGSVTRLKGEGRPIQDESARAAVLASLEMVNAVVVFEEDTPIEIIRTLRPEVLVKGADYRLHEVVGADVVQGYGGKVLLAEIVPGHGTTETIAKLVG